MSRLESFREWLFHTAHRILKSNQPKPAYKIYRDIMTKPEEEPEKKPSE